MRVKYILPAAYEYKEENITDWKFVTVEVHGPFLGKLLNLNSQFSLVIN